jgi:hypothetical protein
MSAKDRAARPNLATMAYVDASSTARAAHWLAGEIGKPGTPLADFLVGPGQNLFEVRPGGRVKRVPYARLCGRIDRQYVVLSSRGGQVPFPAKAVHKACLLVGGGNA